MKKLKNALLLFFLVFTIYPAIAQQVQDSLSTTIIDTVLPVSIIDTIPKAPEKIDLTKKNYILGGITVVGNETISEQSILIFSGLVNGQAIKIPGDKLTSAIKKLWNSKLFSNVDVYATKMDGNTIYLEIAVRELSKVGKVK